MFVHIRNKLKLYVNYRYIEIFRSTLYELMNATNSGPGPERHGGNRFTRPSPYDRGDRFGGMNRYGVGKCLKTIEKSTL